MRRQVRARVEALAPFLTFDPDPYIVVSAGGPARLDHRRVHDVRYLPVLAPLPASVRNRINYMRNSVKAVVDAYDGTTTFYVFDASDPIIAAYRGDFPQPLPRRVGDADGLRKHVRYPELMLQLQAAVYGLYHMTNPTCSTTARISGRGDRSRHGRAAPAGSTGDGAELRADDLARRDAASSSSRSCRSLRPTATI